MYWACRDRRLDSLKDDALNGGVLIHIHHIGYVEELRCIVVHIFDIHSDGQIATLEAESQVGMLAMY